MSECIQYGSDLLLLNAPNLARVEHGKCTTKHCAGFEMKGDELGINYLHFLGQCGHGNTHSEPVPHLNFRSVRKCPGERKIVKMNDGK